MTVSQLADSISLNCIALPDGSREIDGVYIGDLLSWVMGKAKENNAWITIMSNINVIAVASLVDVSCIILAEGVTLEKSIVDAANSKIVNILSTDMTAYEVAAKLAAVLK